MRQGQQNRRGRGRAITIAREPQSVGAQLRIQRPGRENPGHARAYRGEVSFSRPRCAVFRRPGAGGELSAARRALHRIIMAYREQFNQPAMAQRQWPAHARAASPATAATSSVTTRARRGSTTASSRRRARTSRSRQPRQHGGYEAGNRPEAAAGSDRPFRQRPWPLPRSALPARSQPASRPRAQDSRARPDRDRDRQGEAVAAAAGAPAGARRGRRVEQPSAGANASQQPHEQPEFLRRPVRRARSSESEETAPPARKSEPTRRVMPGMRACR